MPFDLAKMLRNVPQECRQKPPVMPVRVACHEAKLLHEIVSKQRDEMAKIVDFNIDNLDGLPLAVEALETQERTWSIQRGGQDFGECRRQAEEFRSGFVSSARFLLRKDENAVTEIDRISEGSGIEDLSTDLNDIAALAERPECAAKLALDKNLPQDLPAHARALGKQLVKNKDTTELLEVQAQRNLLYWVLDEVVVEVRAAAKYLNRDNPKKLAAISSSYEAKRKRSARARSKTAEPKTVDPKTAEPE